MYERIIVPIDGTERALSPLSHAETLSRTWGRPLEVVHVATPDDPPAEAEPEGHEVVRIHHQDAAEALRGRVLATEPPGLLCMASRGRTAIGEMLFGTVTGQIIRTLHAPLVVTGPELLAPTGPGEMRRMLVCLDGSTTSAAILPIVRTWATELGLEVRLLHIAYPAGDPASRQVSIPEETRVVTAELERTAQDLEADGIDVDWRVIEDTTPATGIVRQAAHRTVDLIAMATHGRTGLGRILTGSVATEVFRKSPLPVLTVRPERLQ